MTLQNDAYERALLGAILLDNSIMRDMTITSLLFDTVGAERVYGVIEKMIAASEPVNILTVSQKLPADAGYIARLTDTHSAANAGYYVAELLDLAHRRGIMRLTREVTEMIADCENQTEDIISAIDRTLFSIAMNGSTKYKTMADLTPRSLDEIERAYNAKGALQGIHTGFKELDEKTNGWQKQTLNIIGARPGAGKTSIALNMASAALRYGSAIGFYSAEMSGTAIIKRMISDWGSVEYSRLISGYLMGNDLEKIQEACVRIVASKMFMNDQPNIHLRDLLSDARRMKRKENVDIIFIDYLSLVVHDRRDVPRHERVAEISKALKGLARELDIPIVVLSQLTRAAQNERPNLSQLRESGAVEEDADFVALLWNKGYTDQAKSALDVLFICEKHRNGPTGDIPMIFKPSRMRFAEKEEGAE